MAIHVEPGGRGPASVDPVLTPGGLDRTFKALGDETRRAMLTLLVERGESSAGELGEPFDIAQPTASRHLKVLEEAGLVRRRIRGREHLFRLDPGTLRDAERWIEWHRTFWEGALDQLGEVVDSLTREDGTPGTWT